METYTELVKNALPPNARLVMLALRGSHAHGTFLPSTEPTSVDDIDLMGVVVMDDLYYLGLPGGGNETREIKLGELDIVIYEFRKFLGMASKSNPNIFPILWLNPQHYLYQTATWKSILEHRYLFSSQLALNTFIGYAKGQMTQAQTGLAFKGHAGEKRRALFARLGYDAKSAAHTIRLLRMVKEFLATGVMTVDRTGIDAQELMTLKRGEVGNVESILTEMDTLVKDIEALKSDLPELPDFKAISALSTDLLKNELRADDRERNAKIWAAKQVGEISRLLELAKGHPVMEPALMERKKELERL